LDGSSSSNEIRAATVVYPNGRTIGYDYGSSGGIDDVISRIANLKESSSTYATYTYLGAGTIVRIDYPTPQARLDLWGGTTGTSAGLDRFGRTIDQRWYDYGGSADRDRYAYGYDRDSSHLQRNMFRRTRERIASGCWSSWFLFQDEELRPLQAVPTSPSVCPRQRIKLPCPSVIACSMRRRG